MGDSKEDDNEVRDLLGVWFDFVFYKKISFYDLRVIWEFIFI